MGRRSALLLVFVFAALVLPAHASAAPTRWAAQAEVCGGWNDAERGSGQMDAQGRLYLPCSVNEQGQHDNYVLILNAAGQRIGKVPLTFTPGFTDRASDVAPSPDGSFLYVIKYNEYTVYRFDRQGDGTYRARSQAEWSLAAFPDFGATAPVYKPRGQFLATDATGHIYLSTGLWTCQAGSPHCTDDAIVKYAPSGALVTRFGRKRGGSWALGDSHGSFGGVAVTADGRRVFAVDINNNRVQRFERAGDGTYGAILAMGHRGDQGPGRGGACYGDGALAAPYDVTLTPRGELLVINTTCYNTGAFGGQPIATVEVQRFGQDGSVRGSILTTSRGDHRIHGIAVDRSNNIHLIQGKLVMRPAAGYTDAGADAGGGGPMGGAAAVDATAPVITGLGAAPATTTGTAVTINIGAADAIGVAHVRIREDGVQGGWMPFAPSFAYGITERIGAHQLVFEVRDAAGNVSAPAALTVTRTAPPVAPSPVQPTPVQPKPVQPKPAQPKPVQPTPVQPAAPGVAGGGGAVDGPRPTITKAAIPVQVFRGRAISVGVTATGAAAVTGVRYSTNGRWTAWQPLRGRSRVLLPTGLGWKGVLVQVQDAAGRTSVPLFQPVLVGPRGIGWAKGSKAADRIKLGAGAQHVDSSTFDKQVDRISCGAGRDTVFAQAEDVVAKDCERVVRVVIPAW